MNGFAASIRAFALSFPEAEEHFPWGESAFKVRGRVFTFMRADATGLGITVKLPISRYFALEYPFAKPTGYNLGKSGWVSASFNAGNDIPMDVLRAWITESYQAIAPKQLGSLVTHKNPTAL